MYAVDGPSLRERVIQSYNSRAWLAFLRLFTPQYLAEGTHPYHCADDELVARQNSRIVPVAKLDPATCAVITAPVRLFREIQRRYITFRDHVWRSGALGFTQRHGMIPDRAGPVSQAAARAARPTRTAVTTSLTWSSVRCGPIGRLSTSEIGRAHV